MAFSSPYILTVPSSCMSISFSKPFIWVLIRLLISSALNISSHPFQYFFLHYPELGPQAPVYYRIPDPYHKPREDGAVFPEGHHDLFSGKALEPLPHLGDMRLGKGHRGLNESAEPSGPLVGEPFVRRDYVRQELYRA